MAEPSPFNTTGPSTIGAGLALAAKHSVAQSRWVERETARRGRNPGTMELARRSPEQVATDFLNGARLVQRGRVG